MAIDPVVDKAFAELIAAMMPELEAFMREKLRVAFVAGVSIGQERNQNVFAEATTKALEAMKALQAATRAAEPKVVAAPISPPATRKNGGYSGVTDAVRRTLREIGRAPTGISIPQIQKHIVDNIGRRDINAQQIRSSLTLLQSGNEVERLQRGLYKAGPKLVSNGSAPNGSASLFQHQPVAMQ